MTTATILRPKRQLAQYLESHAANTLTKSILAVATPQYAQQIGQLAGQLAGKFNGLQVVAACADTVGFGIQRDGFSFAVYEQHLKVHDVVAPSTLGAHASSAHAPASAALRLTIGSTDTVLPLANTMFHSADSSALFVASDTNLQGAHIELPTAYAKRRQFRPAAALSDTLQITSCQDNMLKTIDGQAAASFLEEAVPLVAPTSESRTVFAELNGGELFKVTAGGGGLWSPRTRMLVLDTASRPKVGDTIRFWLSEVPLQGPQLEGLESYYSELEGGNGGVVLESAPQQESLNEQPLSSGSFLPVFGAGSEQGFFVNGQRHSVAAESVWFAAR